MGENSNEKPQGVSERAARLVDVARMADVSRATAARVLGGYGKVHGSYVDRVLEAARALNYRPNDVARSMRSGRTLTIGVIAANLANSYFSGVVRAIISTAAASAYRVLVLDSDDDIENEIEAVHLLSEKRVDGVIVAPASPTRFEHLAELRTSGIPVVLIDRRLENSGIGAVTTEDRQAASDAIDLLVARGHKRIGLLVSATGSAEVTVSLPSEAATTARDRLMGATDAAAKAGIKLKPEWIRFCPPSIALTTAAAHQLLEVEPRLTAIFTTNEEATLGLISACNDRRIAIGRDLALISFDDANWTSVFSPALSVIRRPIHEMGEEAVTLLLEQMQNAPARSVVLKAALIDRGSAEAMVKQS